MTITPAHLTVMRVDAESARQCVNEARPLMPESGPVVRVFVNAEILAGHVERLAAEVERLQALLDPTRAPDAAEPCPGSRGW